MCSLRLVSSGVPGAKFWVEYSKVVESLLVKMRINHLLAVVLALFKGIKVLINIYNIFNFEAMWDK